MTTQDPKRQWSQSWSGHWLPRLPVHVEPYRGEAWVGYTRRVAEHHGTTRAILMRHVYAASGFSIVSEVNWRDIGVCADDTTYLHFARVFALDVAQVRAMHLQRYARSAWPEAIEPGTGAMIEPLTQGFDPIRTRLDPPTRLPIQSDMLDGIVPRRMNRHCDLCLRDKPDYYSIKWQVTWLPACVEHRRLLTENGQRPHATKRLAAVLEAQAEIERVADDPLDDTLLVHYILAYFRQRHRLAHVTGEAAAKMLPEALTVCQGDSPLHRLINCRGRRLRNHFDREISQLIPEGVKISRHRLANIECALPEDLIIGDLTDILYPSGISHINRLVTIAVRFGSGESWHDATTHHPEAMMFWEFTEALRTLEEAGRLEAFWWAVGRCCREVENTDLSNAPVSRCSRQLSPPTSGVAAADLFAAV